MSKLSVTETKLPGVLVLEPRRFEDARGFFSEIWNRADFAAGGIGEDYCQDNLARSRGRGTVRGLHLQQGSAAQSKLLFVLRGRIFDVVADVDRNSPGFGQHLAVELSEERPAAIRIPAGYAHGYCTLSEDTLVLYKVDRHYDAASEAGVLWSDPDLAIDWPVSEADAIVSDKDRALPLLKDFKGRPR